MPAISSGGSASFSIANGNLSVSCYASAQYTVTLNGSTLFTGSYGKTFGPITGNVVITSVNGTIQYQSSGYDGPDQDVAMDSQTGNLSSSNNFMPFKRMSTLAMIGDSLLAYAESTLAGCTITDNGDGTANLLRTSHGSGAGDKIRISAAPSKSLNVMDSDVLTWVDANNLTIRLGGVCNEVTSTAGNAIVYFQNRKSNRGVLNHLELKLGYSLSTKWLSVGGARIANISTLIDDSSIATKSDVGLICLGMNNIYADGATLASMQADMTTLLDKAKYIANSLIILSVPPRDSTDAAWSAGKSTVHIGFNAWLREKAKAIGAKFIDTWRVQNGGATFVNAAATNPDPVAGFMWNVTSDKTHFGPRGARAIGDAVYAAIVELGYQVGPDARASHPSTLGADAGNLLTNSTFSATTAVSASGAIQAGTAATGFSVSNATVTSVTPSMVTKTISADGDAVGSWQRLTMSGAGAVRFNFPSISGLISAGNYYQLSCRVRVTSAVGLVDAGFFVFLTLGSVGSIQCHMFNHDSNTNPILGDWEGYYKSKVFYVPSGVTATTIYINPTLSAAQSSSMTFDIAEPELRLITAL